MAIFSVSFIFCLLFSQWYWLQTFHTLDQTMLIYLSASIEKMFLWRPRIDITLEKDYDFLYEIVSHIFLFEYRISEYDSNFYFQTWRTMKCKNGIYPIYLSNLINIIAPGKIDIHSLEYKVSFWHKRCD